MMLQRKELKLFLWLGGFFVANALIAECVGVKIFSLEQTLGLSPISLSFFGESNLAFNLTAGVLLWPVVFVMTDVINEYYGRKGVKFLSFLTVGLILYAFFMFFLSIRLVPADFWPGSHISPSLPPAEQDLIRSKVADFDYAFGMVFGQGLWIIVGSVIAFLVGQILDVFVFHKIKMITGERLIWLRATGSTLVSQFVDSFVVLFVAFYIGAGWSFKLVLAIGLVNYLYKVFMAIVLTPLIYLAHHWIDWYLGEQLADKMKLEALHQ